MFYVCILLYISRSASACSTSTVLGTLPFSRPRDGDRHGARSPSPGPRARGTSDRKMETTSAKTIPSRRPEPPPGQNSHEGGTRPEPPSWPGPLLMGTLHDEPPFTYPSPCDTADHIFSLASPIGRQVAVSTHPIRAWADAAAARRHALHPTRLAGRRRRPTRSHLCRKSAGPPASPPDDRHHGRRPALLVGHRPPGMQRFKLWPTFKIDRRKQNKTAQSARHVRV